MAESDFKVANGIKVDDVQIAVSGDSVIDTASGALTLSSASGVVVVDDNLVVTGSLTATVTGNTDTASKLETARVISLGGDLSGSVSFDGSTNVTITAAVEPDSVALGTDTTGNYVEDVVGGTGVTVSHTPGEGSSASFAIGQDVGTSASVQFGQLTTTGDVVVGGDLTVNGTTTTINTETINLADNIIVLNSNETGSPTQNAGIEVERGTSPNVALRWNETSDRWELTEDGDIYYDIATEDYVDGQSIATLDDIGDVVITSASAGQFLKWNGTAWVNDEIELGTDTVGNYVADVTGGTGVTVTHTPGEGSSPSIAIGQAVGTSSSVTFAAVTAPLIGNASTATSLQTARAISLGGDLSGSVSFDGTANVTITATVQADSVALGTDTTGNYVSNVVSGSGITVTHTPGEGSSASVAINATLDNLSDVTVPAPSNGQVLTYISASSAWVASEPTGGTEQTNTTISSSAATEISSFGVAEAETAEFTVKVKQRDGITSSKVLVSHDGALARYTEYGKITFDRDYGGPTPGSGGTLWVTQTSNFGNTTISSVAYGNELWVAAGGGLGASELRTSTDGITWTTQTSNFGTTRISSVAYGSGLWVAGGNSGQLRTSTDAITWTTQISNFGNTSISSIAYGNNLWVAVGSGTIGEIRTSTDGISWQTRTSTATTGINSVAYGNGLWVFGTRIGGIFTSTDAIEWVSRDAFFGNTQIRSVAYGNGLWVAAGYAGRMRISTDGITWVTQTSTFGTTIINSVAYGNGLWVAVGWAGQIRISTDGTSWTTQTSNFGNTQIQSVAYGDGLWIAGAASGQLRTSEVELLEPATGQIPLTLSADISGSNVRLLATITDADTHTAYAKVLKTVVEE